jgi:hypothetical protein
MAFGLFASAHPISPSWRVIRRIAINNTASDLAIELQKIYDSEINVRIGWFWDCGIEIRLGDDMNGYLAEETVSTVAEIVSLLQEAIAHFYPGSSDARSLSPELRERAKQRLFQPPKIGRHCRYRPANLRFGDSTDEWIGKRCGITRARL